MKILILILCLLVVASSCYAAEWECVDMADKWICRIHRYPVINGWLVSSNTSVVFVPDAAHAWKVIF